MTDKERLQKLENGSTFDNDDINWLLRQARYNLTSRETVEVLGETLKQSMEQNQRYKQALEFYADEQTYTDEQYTSTGELVGTGHFNVMIDNGEKARQALKDTSQ